MEFLPSRQFIAVVLWLLPTLTSATALTEEISLQAGLNQADFVRLLDSRMNLARGTLEQQKTWVNPVLALSREELGDETETSLWLQQTIDFSGQRKLNSEAAKTGLNIAEAHNQQQRMQRTASIRQHFYQLLFEQQQQRLLNHWVAKFSTVEATMKKREAAGDVSGYDRLRISREKVDLLSRQRQSVMQYEANWQQLRGVIGLQNSQQFDTVEGQLMPTQLPSFAAVEKTAADKRIVQSPALLQQQHQLEASRLTARAVARSRFPEMTVGIGIKKLDTPEFSDSGLMLSAAIPLALFDRKQGARQQSTAAAAQLESEYQLALQQYQLRLHALWNKSVQLRDNAMAFSQQSVAISNQLVAIAETSYQMNEVGVLELIDAYRSTLEAEISALKLALEARMSRIALDEITAGVYQ